MAQQEGAVLEWVAVQALRSSRHCRRPLRHHHPKGCVAPLASPVLTVLENKTVCERRSYFTNTLARNFTTLLTLPSRILRPLLLKRQRGKKKRSLSVF